MGMYDYDRRGYTGRVGMAYLVPYYRGMNYADEAGLTMPALSGHSSDMASVDLNTSSYLSVRIHGVDTDFADFYTIDIVNDLPYSRGTGAYKVSYCVLEDGYGDACSLAFPCKNGEPCETVGRQANKHDLATYADNDKLKGFFHGFVQHQKRRFTTETFYTDYKYYRRYMISYKEILEAVRYGEA